MDIHSIRVPLGALLLVCAPFARACDLCSVYTAGMAHGETSGWLAGVSEQFSRYDQLRDQGHRLSDDSGQYLDSSITQLFVGYGITDRLTVQVNLPYIHRSFERPEFDGIDKGTAVRDVASLLGYAIADTIAIGDSDNDTAMLKAAGTSVAMGNAIHGIQAFCNIITTDIRDNGLANAFKTLGLA